MRHFNDSVPAQPEVPESLPAVPSPSSRQLMSFQARLAELLLLTRLRARISRSLALRSPRQVQALQAEKAGVLARFALIIAVTCKSWFHSSKPSSDRHQRKL